MPNVKGKPPKTNKTVTQTLIFSKSEFKSAAAAKKWAKDHGFKSSSVDETESSYRIRQFNSDRFKKGSFSTIKITDGVSAVIAKPKTERASTMPRMTERAIAKPFKNLHVQFVSLLFESDDDQPANREEVVYRAEGYDPSKINFKRFVPVERYDKDKGIIWGVIAKPYEVDTEETFHKPDEIERARDWYMKHRGSKYIDRGHDYTVGEQGFMCESWIVKEEGDPFWPDPKYIDSWVAGVKIENPKSRKEARAGKCTGFSLAGLTEYGDEIEVDGIEVEHSRLISAETARRKSNMKDEKGFFSRLLGRGREERGEFKDLLESQDVMRLVYTFREAIDNVYTDDEITNKSAAVIEITKEFLEAFSKIERVERIGKMISAANMKNIRGAFDALGALISNIEGETEKSATATIREETEMERAEMQKLLTEALDPISLKLEEHGEFIGEVKAERTEVAKKATEEAQRKASEKLDERFKKIEDGQVEVKKSLDELKVEDPEAEKTELKQKIEEQKTELKKHEERLGKLEGRRPANRGQGDGEGGERPPAKVKLKATEGVPEGMIVS